MFSLISLCLLYVLSHFHSLRFVLTMKHFMQPQTAILRKAHSTDPLSSPSLSSAKPRPYQKAKSTKENAPPSNPNSMAYDSKQSPAMAAKLKREREREIKGNDLERQGPNDTAPPASTEQPCYPPLRQRRRSRRCRWWPGQRLRARRGSPRASFVFSLRSILRRPWFVSLSLSLSLSFF